MVDQIIHNLLTRLKEVNFILETCTDGTMLFEQANVIARFYYDCQDTNVLIDEAERMATEDTEGLREFAVSIRRRPPDTVRQAGSTCR